jgi:hypothetical protein
MGEGVGWLVNTLCKEEVVVWWYGRLLLGTAERIRRYNGYMGKRYIGIM